MSTKPCEAITPISAAEISLPFLIKTFPFLTSSPESRILFRFLTISTTRILSFSIFCISSKGITASAPFGIDAPVMIFAAEF